MPCIAVGQFKELVESSETDQPLQETLKKVLNFTSNGWQKAREHAMRAVSTDNRMRAWCADDSLEDGLLFKCYLGRVDLEAPVGESSQAQTCLLTWACLLKFPFAEDERFHKVFACTNACTNAVEEWQCFKRGSQLLQHCCRRRLITSS